MRRRLILSYWRSGDQRWFIFPRYPWTREWPGFAGARRGDLGVEGASSFCTWQARFAMAHRNVPRALMIGVAVGDRLPSHQPCLSYSCRSTDPVPARRRRCAASAGQSRSGSSRTGHVRRSEPWQRCMYGTRPISRGRDAISSSERPHPSRFKTTYVATCSTGVACTCVDGPSAACCNFVWLMPSTRGCHRCLAAAAHAPGRGTPLPHFGYPWVRFSIRRSRGVLGNR